MTSVLWITTDQHRADVLGCAGNPVVQTPNIDAVAAAGTRYTAARTPNPFCQPARASLLTGMLPSSHGVTFNGTDLPTEDAERTVASHFARAGHATGFFGKAHFASTYPFTPTGALESVEGSASMPEGWTGPYFGFEHVQLICFGHNMRISPLQGRWQWCLGPAPFGLHYGRWLYRDGVKAGNERIRLMTPEAAGAVWDETQTWKSALPEEDHQTTFVADRATEWIGDLPAGKDFFAWVSFTDPHHPMDPPAPWSNMYAAADCAEVLPSPPVDEHKNKPGLHEFWTKGNKGEMAWANPGGANYSPEQLATMTAAYYGMISQMDAAIGRVLAALEASGRADDTVVVITADHGEFLGQHRMIFKGPFGYDSLLKVPLIVRGPGFAAGAVVDDAVATLDLPATSLRAAGLAVPSADDPTMAMDSRPLQDGHREATLHEDDFEVFIKVPLRTLATNQYKLTRYEDQPGVGELYDLDDDPEEHVNRWDDVAFAAVKADLLTELAAQYRPTTRTLERVGLVG